jgi:hypothetical protein
MMTRVHRPGDEQPIVRGSTDEQEADETYVYTRVTDRSLWFRLRYYQEKYSILTVPILFLLLLGARQWIRDTMKETTVGLQAQIDTTRATIIKGEVARDSVNQKLTIILRVTCISSRATKSELALVGLNCSNFSSLTP